MQSRMVLLQELCDLLTSVARLCSGLFSALLPLAACNTAQVTFPPGPASKLVGKWSANYTALDCLLDKFAKVPSTVMQEVRTPCLKHVVGVRQCLLQ